MAVKLLTPNLELLSEEYVLVQAWKKTASWIRRHNWFSNTLELDHAAVNLPTFIDGLRERLQSWKDWEPHRLRMVLAPKSQTWKINNDVWEPPKEQSEIKLRPLAHVNLEDQVVATALMLCLADRIETIQGDPRKSVDKPESRKRVISYGNRLFCSNEDELLRHRWGSTKLYRAYFQDYRKFVSRPEIVAKQILKGNSDKKVFVVYTDLKQFYDRVTPELLREAVNHHARPAVDDSRFFDFLLSVLNWNWSHDDKYDVQTYVEQSKLKDFTRVTLPQGLIASGFFANLVLLSVDKELRDTIGSEIAPNILLLDICRYVDDFRVVVAVDHRETEHLCDPVSEWLKETVSEWLKRILDKKANGLELSDDKTEIAEIGGEKRPLVRQSMKMKRIQTAISGGFDALGGEEIIDAIQGLLSTQDALSSPDNYGRFSPLPDVRDVTVARFSAARYRTTFRSIRPLFLEKDLLDETRLGQDDISPDPQLRKARTQDDLDEDARVFASSLIQRWIKDPSNIRLLRIGLDLWPDEKVLADILPLLRPYTREENHENRKASLIIWYSLAEILRAGATETGMVPDAESLPSEIDIESYREKLCEEATRLIALPACAIPWYLRQQALLFLAAYNPVKVTVADITDASESPHYLNMIQFLRGEGSQFGDSDFVTYAVLARRTFMDRDRASALTSPGLNKSRMKKLAEIDPAFLLELRETKPESIPINSLPKYIREGLCLSSETPARGTLAYEVMSEHPHGPLRNELSILDFAQAFLEQLSNLDPPRRVVTPEMVKLKFTNDRGISRVKNLSIRTGQNEEPAFLYAPPSWCSDNDRWRFQLGFLLRFILSGNPDFTRSARPASWREPEPSYRSAGSHWHQRLYGLYSGHTAFGDDWLPITDWFEKFLLALLSWPGCKYPSEFRCVESGIDKTLFQIGKRIEYLNGSKGDTTGTLLLPLQPKRPTNDKDVRSLRACVIQTVTPTVSDFQEATDLELNESGIRQKHRRHLSAALEAVKRMLVLRETHKGNNGKLDWLIFPELAVHPKDVRTHLIPFARAYKTIILAGITYEKILVGDTLINSALWIIPECSEENGLQIVIRRQGKKHLALNEQAFKTSNGEDKIRGFRPCQWLIEYPWSNASKDNPLRLTAAVCYDGTDLALAEDLRHKSDVLAIPALNKDGKTFDNMTETFQHHMFQVVIVVNNGEYGGSNAYWPNSDSHIRRIFHTHGQLQATISFLDIDDISDYQSRTQIPQSSKDNESTGNTSNWKHPPAGLKGISES